MQRARIVVLRAAVTPGFWWELRHAKMPVNPERILLWFPTPKKTEYKTFVSEASKLFINIPSCESTAVPLFVAFRSDWSPIIIERKPSIIDELATFPMDAGSRGLTRLMYKSLKQLYTDTDVNIPQRSFAWLVTANAVALSTLLFALFLLIKALMTEPGRP